MKCLFGLNGQIELILRATEKISVGHAEFDGFSCLAAFGIGGFDRY